MKQTFKPALLATLPVLTGYLVLGFGFGIIMKANGFGVALTAAMSLLIYAGSMQYAAIGLMTGGASLLTVALTINVRHLFYGISMLEKYRDVGKAKPYLIFGLTDETYSLVCTDLDEIPAEQRRGYCLWVTLLNWFYWIAGATIGAQLGAVLPFPTDGLDFVMTAMFVVIFLEAWLKEKQHWSSLIGLICSVGCLLLFGAEGFMLPTMAAILLALYIMRKPIEKAEGGALK
ncbi:MAG: AzlC family ABC transporter permease [Oscillospiraceae bacterium]|nr:AzlC family ABC transporter permease [Oscillospiraceae bacterium]